MSILMLRNRNRNAARMEQLTTFMDRLAVFDATIASAARMEQLRIQGREPAATFCSRVLNSFTTSKPPKPIGDYCAHLFRHSKDKLEGVEIVMGVILQRFREKLIQATRGDVGGIPMLCAHRLTLVAFIIAVKVTCDTYDNMLFFSQLGGVTLPDLLKMELEFLQLLDYGVTVTAAECEDVTALFSGESSAVTTPEIQQPLQNEQPSASHSVVASTLPSPGSASASSDGDLTAADAAECKPADESVTPVNNRSMGSRSDNWYAHDEASSPGSSALSMTDSGCFTKGSRAAAALEVAASPAAAVKQSSTTATHVFIGTPPISSPPKDDDFDGDDIPMPSGHCSPNGNTGMTSAVLSARSSFRPSPVNHDVYDFPPPQEVSAHSSHGNGLWTQGRF